MTLHRSVMFALALLVALPGTATAGKIFKTYGDFMSVSLPVAAAAITIANRDWEGLVEFTRVMIYSDITTRGLKRIVGRERPNGADKLSFPSGHSTRVFAAAAYLDQRYGRALGLPAYLLAWTVGASRVDARAHYWSDVFGAAVITTLLVCSITSEGD